MFNRVMLMRLALTCKERLAGRDPVQPIRVLVSPGSDFIASNSKSIEVELSDLRFGQ